MRCLISSKLTTNLKSTRGLAMRCPICNKEFELSYRQQYGLHHGIQNRVFCSNACSLQRGAKTKAQCGGCGELFFLSDVQKYTAKTKVTKNSYCSKRCSDVKHQPRTLDCYKCGKRLVLSFEQRLSLKGKTPKKICCTAAVKQEPTHEVQHARKKRKSLYKRVLMYLYKR